MFLEIFNNFIYQIKREREKEKGRHTEQSTKIIL